MLINLLIGVICCFYIALIIVLIFGWFMADKSTILKQNPTTTFSIIVPFRNEEVNISACLNSLLHLGYPSSLFEVILVNDHSHDNSVHIINSIISDWANFHLISLQNESGKKAALTFGIKQAKSEYIVTTDADCTYNSFWLSELNNKIQSTHPHMVVAPVQFKQGPVFSQLLALDFLSLTGTMASFHFPQPPYFK